MKRINPIYFGFLIMLMVFLSIETGRAQQATFNCTENAQSFIVPNGVIGIHIQAWGAQAASDTVGVAGLGGFAEGYLMVTPGQRLDIFVGCQGCTQFDGVGCGGFNGGGDARSDGVEPTNGRGGGGGASDVRVEGACCGTSLKDRVIVAAGGGGACGSSSFNGGNGGGLVGGNATGQGSEANGGTQDSGGMGGTAGDCNPGVFGDGGDSGNNNCSGGGGGWYGGGSGCGSGGGSSYIGGVTNGSTTGGVREGDGLVVLSCEGEGSVVLPCIIEVVVTPIPTLSEWGLVAMVGVLGLVGFMVIRRRKVSA